MFEREIKFISDFTLNKIKKLGSLFTFEKLAGLDIHPAILQYVSAELDYIIYEDRNKLLQNSVFDYSGTEILNYFNLIGKEIKKNKKIAFEDIKILIVQAVSFNANYVAHPNWSLSKLIFHEKELFSAQELRLMLNYIYYYGYIKEVLLGYISKKRTSNVSVAEFDLLLGKIDKEILAKQESKIIDIFLNAIGDFFNEGGINKSKVPGNAVELLLKEKNLVDKLLTLKNALPFDEKQRIDINDIKDIIISKTVEKDKNQETLQFEETSEEKEEDIFDFEHEDAGPVFKNQNKADSNGENDLGKTQIINTKEIDLNSEIENPDEEVTSQLNYESADDNEDNGLIIEENEPEETSEIENERQSENSEYIKDENVELNANELENESENTLLEKKNYINEPYEFGNKKEPVKENDNEEEFEDLVIEENKEDGEKVNDDNENQEDEDKAGYELVKNKFDLNETQNKDEINEIETDGKVSQYEEIDEQKEDEINDVDIESNQEIEDIDKIEKEIEQLEQLEDKIDPFTKNKIDTDIFRFITQRDMERIISNVFNEDRDDFTNTMEKIAECGNYDEAIEILKGVFFTYRVSPYTRDAITLTNVVSFFFNQAS